MAIKSGFATPSRVCRVKPSLTDFFNNLTERISLHPPRVDANGRELLLFIRMRRDESDNQAFFSYLSIFTWMELWYI